MGTTSLQFSSDGWKVIGVGDASIMENQTYSLLSLGYNEYFRYDDRKGANLGWSGQDNLNTEFPWDGIGSNDVKWVIIWRLCANYFGSG